MKKLLLILVLAAAAFAAYWFWFKGDDGPSAPKQQPLALKKHDESFNQGIDSLLLHYFDIKNALVEGDSQLVKNAAASLLVFVNGFNLDELKKDTTGIYQTAADQLTLVKTNAESMAQSQTITDLRHDFSDMSDNLYPFLRVIHYEGKKLYWQFCEMPFGENTRANWISGDTSILNPYFGKNHPVHKAVMLNSGEIQDTIKAQ